MRVFLCHSSDDKIFARELAKRLRDCGVNVWIDESEIKVGDSLIERIGKAIESVDFVAAIISEASVESEWVKRELRIAIHREIDERRVVVLPILISDVKLPPFLREKLYADFTDPNQFEASFADLAKVIGFNTYDLERESDFRIITHSLTHHLAVKDKDAKEAIWMKISRFTPVSEDLHQLGGEHFHATGRLEFVSSEPGTLQEPKIEGGITYLTTEFDPPLGKGELVERKLTIKCTDSPPEDKIDVMWIPTNSMKYMELIIQAPTERPLKGDPELFSVANSKKYTISVPIEHDKHRAYVKIDNPVPGVKYILSCPW